MGSRTFSVAGDIANSKSAKTKGTESKGANSKNANSKGENTIETVAQCGRELPQADNGSMCSRPSGGRRVPGQSKQIGRNCRNGIRQQGGARLPENIFTTKEQP